MNLDTWLAARKETVDGWLHAWHAALEGPAPLTEAMGYSLFAGGKRLRPILALAAAEACGVAGAPAPLVDLCRALELVHTYSLIHDDLPALDDDDLRRGRPTCHKVHGEAMAVLAGDALLTEAFRCLAGPAEASADETRIRLALLRRLAGAIGAGTAAMVGGQVLDITRVAVGQGLEAVEAVHRGKTGALITCAVAGGAEAVGAGVAEVARLEAYGAAAGLAFQVVDDVLDETADAEALGKAAGKDAERNTATVPRAIGLEAARARAAELTDAALAAVTGLGDAAEPLRALARRMEQRRR